jgi:hypothetical protein
MKKDEEKLRELMKIFESLSGDIEEIDVSEAGELLQSAGIDYDSVRRKMYESLTERAASFRLKGEPVPADLQQALNVFRPPNAPPRNEEEAQRQARSMVGRFLEEAGRPPESLRFAFSYRNRGELTKRDIRLLDSVADELRKRLGHKE